MEIDSVRGVPFKVLLNSGKAGGEKIKKILSLMVALPLVSLSRLLYENRAIQLSYFLSKYHLNIQK